MKKWWSYSFTRDDTAIVKFFAVLFMMWHHLYGYLDRYEMYHVSSLGKIAGKDVLPMTGSYGNMCVSAFIFLAGFGTFFQLKNAGEKKYSHIIFKKISSLLVTLWKVFIIFVPIAILLDVQKIHPAADWKIAYTLPNTVLNLVGLPLGTRTFNGEWWFISPYIVLIMLMPLFIKWLNRKRANFFVDFICIALISILLFRFGETIIEFLFPDRQIVTAVLFLKLIKNVGPFLMGCLFAKHNCFEKMRRLISYKWIYFPLAFVSLVATVFLRYQWGARYDYLLVVVFVFSIATIFKAIPGITIVARAASKYNTYVWLIHSFFCYQFCGEWLYSFKNPILIFVILGVISYASAIAVYWLFRLIAEVINKLRTRNDYAQWEEIDLD